MHFFAWAFVGFIGLVFLITGRSPFPVFYGRSGGKSGSDPSAFWLRLVGICFTLAALFPLILINRIGMAIYISVYLILTGIFVLLAGMLFASHRRPL